MDWAQFIIFVITIVGGFLTIAGMFLWNRSESRSDMRHMDAKIDAIREMTLAFHEAIRQDMKDFHGRLCDLEARRK